ncbi:MAG: Ig-like domain repeat protein [Verrucomicrobia bacterium]|nr:Ig-like domain repeat protein [Verrucomicrobiota bacterium]
MNVQKAVTALLVLNAGVAALYGQFAQTNIFSGFNLSIPDANPVGVQDLRSVVSDIVRITSVRVRLKISGEFNGDLYGLVRHSSGTTNRISVLLNRPGRTTTDPSDVPGYYGYPDSGFDVTFADSAANDVHSYREVTTPPAGFALSGEWQPDARFVDPVNVTTSSPRTLFLNEFEGLSANGEWTLFLADVSGGASNNVLNSWGLEINGQAMPSIAWTNPAAITYGVALGTDQLNATADVPGKFDYNPSANTVLAAGSNQTLSVTFIPDDTNSYVVATANVTLTVATATLIVTADSQSRAYGSTNPPLTGTLTGVQNGDNITASFHTVADANSAVDYYPITPVLDDPDGRLGNYSVLTDTGTLSVEPALLIGTADNQIRFYGQTNPVFTVTYTGFVNGENAGVLTGTPGGSTVANTNSAVGDYPIQGSIQSTPNYTIRYVDGTLTVTPAPLVVAADDTSRAYGQTNPLFTATCRGLVNGEDTNALGGALLFNTTAVTNSPVGTYAIEPGGLTSTNYAITFSNGTLTVTGFALTVSADNQSRTYGAANPPLTGTLAGVQNGDNITATFRTLADTNSPVGTYPITPAFDDPDGKLGNYSVPANTGTLTIEPAQLTGTADNQIRFYGQTNPLFTVSYTGFVNGENAGVLTGTLSGGTIANTNSPVGDYPIQMSDQSAPNYTVHYLDGTLTVTPAALMVAADDTRRAYGQTNPPFTATCRGLVNGEDTNALGGTLFFNTTADTNSPVGTYAIEPGGLTSTNYAITFSNGTLTVTAFALTVSADNQSRTYGAANPPLTGTLAGVQNGDIITASFHTLADTNSPVGTYPITPVFDDPDGKLDSYTVLTNLGTLTITKAASRSVLVSSANPALVGSNVTFTINLTSLAQGSGLPSGTVQFKIDGADYGAPITLVDGNASLSTATLPAGEHTVSIDYAGDSNFLGDTAVLVPTQVIDTPPIAIDDVIARVSSGGTRVPLSFLLVNDSDADGDALVFDAVDATSAAGGTLSVADGWVFYTPPAGFTNDDSFNYTVRDGRGGMATGSVAVSTLADRASPARLTIRNLGNGTFRIESAGTPWGNYTIEFAERPTNQNWVVVALGTADVWGNFAVEDTPPKGTHSRFYRANYQGDGPLSLPFSLALSSSANPALPGSTVTFTVNVTTVASENVTPSGTAQFRVDGVDYGSPVTLVGGIASFSTATLPLGKHSVGAEYSGDGNFRNATCFLSVPQEISSPPVAGGDVIQRDPFYGTKVSVSDLLANDSEPGGDPLVFDSFSTTTTEGGNLTKSEGWIFYTPPAGFVNADSFTYTVRDSHGVTATATVEIVPRVGNEPSANLMLVDLGNGTYRIVFSGIPWRSYAIEYTESLEQPNWQAIATITADSNGLFEYEDALPPGTPSRFYRSVSPFAGVTASPFQFAAWTNFIAHTNGRTMDMWSERVYPPGWPATPPVLAWNTNCLLYGLNGFTAISQCNEFEGSPGQGPVTLLTRRHAYTRGHGEGVNGLRTNHLAGNKVWFCTASNTVVQMTIAADLIRLDSAAGSNYDYALLVFTEDVPESISPISVISPADLEIHYWNTPDLPYLFLGTEQLGHCAAGVPPFVFPIVKGGDSGSPNMIPSPDNKLIMFSGRATSGFSSQMQADMDALSIYEGLNPANYQLRWYDLSPWEP